MAENSRAIGTVVSEILSIAGLEVVPPTDITNPTDGTYPKQGAPNLEILGAISKNREYIDILRRESGKMVSNVNLASMKSPNKYYNRNTGKYQVFPVIGRTDTIGNKDLFILVAHELATLVYNKAITPSKTIDVRPIDKFTGQFIIADDILAKEQIAKELGIPSFASVNIGTRPTNVNAFGHTFTAVDISASAIFGSTVTDVKGLSAFSWSLHADKNSDRKLNESRPTRFTRGAQTIAGSLVFTLFDESPIRAFAPIQFFHGNSPIAGETGLTDFEEVNSISMPQFDLALTFQNEYGASSTLIIIGIDITDEGGMFSTRQLENEVTYNYKAISIEPIVPVETSADGSINFFEQSSKGIELFEKKRRHALTSDMAGVTFESQYQSTIDDITKTITSSSSVL